MKSLLLLLLFTTPNKTLLPLRVCADPNNLPFSNRAGEGFENRIAELLAKDLRLPLQYEWHAQRRGFLRNTLMANRCDLVTGIATDVDMVATTEPYYRSTYAFVTRSEDHLTFKSFDDPALRTSRIGVQIIGDDYANTPPVHALALRGIVNIHGYRVMGDYQKPNPPARIIDALQNREIDVAIAWGPLAGYFASRSAAGLKVQPLIPQRDHDLPIAYDISMGVRRSDPEFKKSINSALRRNRAAIRKLLLQYHVPLLETQP